MPRRTAFGNLERVLFPADGITKADLLDYYRRIGDVLVPHLRDRPTVLHRMPEGIAGPSFFVKDAPPTMPPWIGRVDIPAETRRGRARSTVTYAVLDDVPSLLWMVGFGCIDLHVALSRRPRWQCPDQILFDLDPTPGVPFALAVRVAHHVRAALDGVGLRAYAKTSGQTGLHLQVPIAAGPTYDQTRRFAHAVAQAVERAYPDEVSTAWARAHRHGVFLDWHQNSFGASIASPYSVRPLPGAPVSCPVRWDEVDEGLDPGAFTMEAVLARVRAEGDLFAPVLEDRQDVRRLLGAGAPRR